MLGVGFVIELTPAVCYQTLNTGTEKAMAALETVLNLPSSVFSIPIKQQPDQWQL